MVVVVLVLVVVVVAVVVVVVVGTIYAWIPCEVPRSLTVRAQR